MSYSKTFDLWKAAAGPLWPAYTQHDFVQQLKGGTLPEDAYIEYMRQDYIFFIHFSHAWALAITKAQTVDEMRFAAKTVNSLLNDELTLHIKACAEFGVTQDMLNEIEERPESVAYTRYMLSVGQTGDLLDLLAALSPCIIGYGEIGQALMAEATSDEYEDWINIYAGAPYQNLCKTLGELIDLVAKRRIGEHPQHSPRWQQLCENFKTATQLEVRSHDTHLRSKGLTSKA